MVNKLSLFLPFLLAVTLVVTGAEELEESPSAILLNYTKSVYEYEPTAYQEDFQEDIQNNTTGR